MSRPDFLDRKRFFAMGLALALGVPPASAAEPTPNALPRSAAKPAAKTGGVKPLEGSLGKGTASGPLLTRDQLRQCLAEQDRIQQESADILQVQRKLERDRTEIQRLGAELDAEKAAVDRSSEAAVNAFNERSRQRGRMIEEYQALAAPFNARIDRLTADKQTQATNCADRRYFEDDYEAIKAGK